MVQHEVYERSPMRIFEQSTQGGLSGGELGAISGRAGIGKSALLIHIALDRIMRDQRVLHISLQNNADHIRAFYDEIFNSIAKAAKLRTDERLALQVERHRMIHAYLDRPFSASDLAQSLDLMTSVMQFSPQAVLIDGFNADDADGVKALSDLARSRDLAIWIGAKTDIDAEDKLATDALFSTVVSLETHDSSILIQARRVHGTDTNAATGLELDPQRLLVKGEDTWDPSTAPFSPLPAECTLYSGGASGAESAFGELAERYGMKEVNFTFPGHVQARGRGAYELNDRELAAGDVSLVYVSRRLNRKYNAGELIRKVLQSLWHQVSRAQQVFVVGVVQEDGTVTGGTGWSVELARMWHKKLWVFDQDKNLWFNWTGEKWEEGLPVVESAHICGTGTRYLTQEGRKALNELFARSFDHRKL